ncbi:MAG TPA: hypothetical protein VE734_12615 [Terriglobales bacterium]|jgi:hypothetical protein|nr:hypothetical protein [Terriglobales bacterium]
MSQSKSPIQRPARSVATPLPLDSEVIEKNLHSAGWGAYVVGDQVNGMFRAVKVGRTEDLRGCLTDFIGAYDEFVYKSAASQGAAFQIECRFYHQYRPTHTRSHPTRSPGTDWECPVCQGF